MNMAALFVLFFMYKSENTEWWWFVLWGLMALAGSVHINLRKI